MTTNIIHFYNPYKYFRNYNSYEFDDMTGVVTPGRQKIPAPIWRRVEKRVCIGAEPQRAEAPEAPFV
ncbi:MAG: hypothetical protein K2H33_05335 [Muribaculaceae bacterium]|nr:hypothetical protein [Muribaculaceae bacterium]